MMPDFTLECRSRAGLLNTSSKCSIRRVSTRVSRRISASSLFLGEMRGIEVWLDQIVKVSDTAQALTILMPC